MQGNFLDTYYNLTYKSVMGHLWVSEFCRQAELVVKTDDDIYVDLYGTFSLAGRLRAEENYRENMFMMGPVNRFFTEIIRSPDHPWNKWLGKQESPVVMKTDNLPVQSPTSSCPGTRSSSPATPPSTTRTTSWAGC